ncbi:hypothetical protein ABIF07_003601 [Bradyrhizobium elkanii]|nr:hypothetical protein [Bradyrhizobium elkanii]MCS3689372.1 hypothetical protein [Bradyrhizobium elkanii]
MFVRIKDFLIYVPIDSAVTIVVESDEKPKVYEQEAYWDDEREQMLDDYD